MDSIPQKQCPRCSNVFPLTHEYYGINKSRASGFNQYCKNCWRNIQSERRKRERDEKGIIPVPDGMRRCSICHEIKPATREHFTTCSAGKYGLQTFCKPCAAKYHRDYRASNPEKISATEKKRSKTDSRRKNQRENSKKRYHLDPLQKQKTRTKNSNRRARMKGAEGHHTAEDEQAQYAAQNGKCWYCGEKLNGKYEIDHINPLSRGGSNWPDNLVATCAFCNRSKHDKLPWEWIGRLL